jgi:hypothetical protein
MLEGVADDLGFDWDRANIGHMARHGVTPAEAEQVMLNIPVEIDYQVIGGEERFVADRDDAGRAVSDDRMDGA